MTTFKEANQVRLALKMKLSQYSWYLSSVIVSSQDGYNVIISAKYVDNIIRKLVSPVVDGVSVKVETR